MNKFPLILAGIVLVAGSASAQSYLYENHDAGVPGSGWTQVKNNPTSQGWIQSADLRAWHEDEPSSYGTSDDLLVSPPMDLSGASSVYVHFNSQLGYADYLANHPSSVGDGENDLWISTNGGANWTEVWTDTRTVNGTEWTDVDISSYAGNSNVRIALRFYGTFAQEWWVDEVAVDRYPTYPPPPFSLAKAGACPGPVILSTAGATPNGSVALMHGLAGTFTKSSGTCAGLTLGLSQPNLGGFLTSDSNGDAFIFFFSAPSMCGRTVQAVDISSCRASNTIVL